MTDNKKAQITDNLSVEDCFGVVQEIEKRSDRYSGDKRAQITALVGEARLAVMDLERYEGKAITGERAKQKVESLFQQILTAEGRDTIR